MNFTEDAYEFETSFGHGMPVWVDNKGNIKLFKEENTIATFISSEQYQKELMTHLFGIKQMQYTTSNNMASTGMILVIMPDDSKWFDGETEVESILLKTDTLLNDDQQDKITFDVADYAAELTGEHQVSELIKGFTDQAMGICKDIKIDWEYVYPDNEWESGDLGRTEEFVKKSDFNM